MPDTITKKSTITIEVGLDEKNIPSEILWQTSDDANNKLKPTNSMSVSFWDNQEKNTFALNLWTKDMMVEEMEAHFLQTMLVNAESFKTATQHDFIAKVKSFCDELYEEMKKAKK